MAPEITFSPSKDEENQFPPVKVQVSKSTLSHLTVGAAMAIYKPATFDKAVTPAVEAELRQFVRALQDICLR